MLWGTLRLLLCMGAIATAGGVVVWLLERH